MLDAKKMASADMEMHVNTEQMKQENAGSLQGASADHEFGQSSIESPRMNRVKSPSVDRGDFPGGEHFE